MLSFSIQVITVYANFMIELIWVGFLIIEDSGSRVPSYEGRIHWLNIIGMALGVLIFCIMIGTLRALAGEDSLNHVIACLLPGNLIITLFTFVGMTLEHVYKALPLEASAMWTTIMATVAWLRS